MTARKFRRTQGPPKQYTPTTETGPWPCACGGKFWLGVGRAGAGGDEEPYLVHSEPTCPEYDSIEDVESALAFSKAQRVRLGIPDV